MKPENIALEYRFKRHAAPNNVQMTHCYAILNNDEYWHCQMDHPFCIGHLTYRKNDYLVWNATKKILFSIPNHTFSEHFGLLAENE